MTEKDTLGTRIRKYRDRLKLSQEELARNAGIDIELIKAIETDEIYPAIGIMVKVSRALGQRLGTFMDDQEVDDPLITLNQERRENGASHKGQVSGHYRYYPLGIGKTDRHMEPFFIVVEPSEEKVLSSHEGEEFIIVALGEIELIYGNDVYNLKAGDTIYYNSLVPHHVGAKGERAEIYAVIYTPF
ncbi:MAG: hypothetical protein PWQ88_347 [Candidatus Methanomethylophilaceae archaeon]|nr:MAG: Cupin domain protein [Thermoplasmatales archaeon 49_6]MDI3482476.1 hypothetical protein [Candidatus Methanomethylophilaceae archaeon]HII99915.1 cupin domain-containing protein [Candidatus Methanomethylophilaceae archaeon]